MIDIHLCFVPECYFDTVLCKFLIGTNERLKHTKGCFNVVNRFRVIHQKKGDMYDKPFGVGIIDKDKREPDYLKECNKIATVEDMVIVWKHKDVSKKHFIIQLNPPLEQWILTICLRNGLDIKQFGFSEDPKKLKKQLMVATNESDPQINNLVKAIVQLNDNVILKLKKILKYLWKNNVDSDIKELIFIAKN
ncbi:MAG: hypothetical protein N2747_03235 [Chitinophagaceae bacterium]|nr:hypothetical protein [Chitinophagaceae bacterium]